MYCQFTSCVYRVSKEKTPSHDIGQAKEDVKSLKTRSAKQSQTTSPLEEPGNLLKNQLKRLVSPRNTGFYA